MIYIFFYVYIFMNLEFVATNIIFSTDLVAHNCSYFYTNVHLSVHFYCCVYSFLVMELFFCVDCKNY